MHHPGETRTIPARAQSEGRRQREVPTLEVQVARIISAAARAR